MLRALVFLAVSFAGLNGLAGTIGFSIQFQGDKVAVQNNGNESAFHVGLFTLNEKNTWQKNISASPESEHLSPQARLETTRASAPDSKSALTSVDPILVLFNDQSGSAMTQLAWRKAPPHAPFTLPYDRQGTQLRIHPPAGNAASNIVKTYAIVVPYAGIAALAQPLQAIQTPPPPVSSHWAAGAGATDLIIETGTGLSGAWLLHESPSGELSLQVITDGKQRGSEQIPAWLIGVRKFGLWFANWLWVFGLLTMGASVWLIKRQRGAAAKAP